MTGSGKRDIFAHFFQNRVIGTAGKSKPSAIKCTAHFVIKVTHCRIMAVNVHCKSSRKRIEVQ